MKITIIGKDKKVKNEINNIVNDLKLTNVTIINNKDIKHNKNIPLLLSKTMF